MNIDTYYPLSSHSSKKARVRGRILPQEFRNLFAFMPVLPQIQFVSPGHGSKLPLPLIPGKGGKGDDLLPAPA